MKLALILFLICAIPVEVISQPAIKIIHVHELATILDESLLVIDVRTGPEYELGYIPGSVNIDLASKDFGNQIENFDRHRPVYFYCSNGHRSMSAAEILISKGFTDVYSLYGGMLHWQRAKKPINY